MTAAAPGDWRWSAQAPTASGKKGVGEAHRIEGGGGGLAWREVTERGGRGGGGFDSSAVDGELWHRSGQKAMGSGGASCAARSEEKRGMGKRKRAMVVLNAFVSATVAWSSGGGRGGLLRAGQVSGGELGGGVWAVR
jgi:hypothetical protein